MKQHLPDETSVLLGAGEKLTFDFLKLGYANRGFNGVTVAERRSMSGAVEFTWWFTTDPQSKTPRENATLVRCDADLVWTQHRPAAAYLVLKWMESGTPRVEKEILE